MNHSDTEIAAVDLENLINDAPLDAINCSLRGFLKKMMISFPVQFQSFLWSDEINTKILFYLYISLNFN